ncbi:MAG: hypothetical protein ABIN94_14580 [Ferruginibacter sp.]
MIFVATQVFSENLRAQQPKMLLLQPIQSSGSKAQLLSTKNASTPSIKPVISPDFYVTQLSFFCKQEIKFEKATKIPFKFRLGSVEDCDRMEGKERRN